MGNCLKLQRGAAWADGHEWEEEEEVVVKGKPAVAKTERAEVKIRVTKRQLQELLEKAGGGGQDSKMRQRQMEKVLAELMNSGVVCYHQQQEETLRGNWRPSLHCIPEAAEES
ncbi:hypothetical protein PR202_ga09387 [Eleusine coracana subsp. coracana]|uniref:Uncharacterized protein n=1 Tax=Eleusine coracana subsp. coracana TaxID=191504 RepID=A0AAV5C2M3_ELECO|nr:hypothetical protein PR202_ga09387 [Eleusine coracana subsp. coracana]